DHFASSPSRLGFSGTSAIGGNGSFRLSEGAQRANNQHRSWRGALRRADHERHRAHRGRPTAAHDCGRALVIRLHDTATGEVHEVRQREPGKLSFYVCGPTVYDVPHLGHGRHVLTYDVLRRYLEWTGVDVHHVSNVTDVDDNIIK